MFPRHTYTYFIKEMKRRLWKSFSDRIKFVVDRYWILSGDRAYKLNTSISY